jgi:50S ribosomal protein L16 3-hydroxylase
MTNYLLNNFNSARFLAEYWQKKPAVFRQAFINFDDPVDESELAGLAQEDDIDSRIVARQKDKWQVSHGPFSTFTKVCKGNWSLLVQSVDQHIPKADNLLKAFNFIPQWRVDDLMVSFSNKGAGVGPHLDQYDVFIIQGKGSRRWQIGNIGQYTENRPHKDLGQINDFEPIIDEVLQPGDMIYIPPGYPHNGVALEDCLNYSVGFRAPTQQELLSSFADFALEHNLFNKRYQDQELAPRQHPSQITHGEVAKLKELMRQMLDSEHFETWLGQHMSGGDSVEFLCDEEMPEYTDSQILTMLNKDQRFYKRSGLRTIFIESQSSTFTFYIQGEGFSVPADLQELCKELLANDIWQGKTGLNKENSLFFAQLMTKLINSGYWYLE